MTRSPLAMHAGHSRFDLKRRLWPGGHGHAGQPPTPWAPRKGVSSDLVRGGRRPKFAINPHHLNAREATISMAKILIEKGDDSLRIERSGRNSMCLYFGKRMGYADTKEATVTFLRCEGSHTRSSQKSKKQHPKPRRPNNTNRRTAPGTQHGRGLSVIPRS